MPLQCMLSLFTRTPNKDLDSQVRCHCIFQMLTFIHFHYTSCQEPGFESLRVQKHHEYIDGLRRTIQFLMMSANHRPLTFTEKNLLLRIEEQTRDIIYAFHLDNNKHHKFIWAHVNDAFSLSLPSVFNTRSLDDSILSIKPTAKPSQILPKMKFIHSQSERKLHTISPKYQLQRRTSIAEFW